MDAAQYNRAMHSAERELIRFVGSASVISRGLSIPFIAAAGAITGLGVAMGAASVEAVRLASSWEQASIALEVMTGSASTAKDLLADISKLAVESPFKLQGLIASAKQLSAYGVTARDLMPTLATLGDVAAGVSRGNLDEMMGRIVLAYGQVRTAGRLRGSELRQFTEAGVPMPAMLAKVLGTAPSQIQDLVQEGKVGANDVMRALNMMTSEGGRFFNMMDRQSKTVAGVWSNFTETLQLGAMRIGQSFLDTFGIKELLDSWREAVAGTGGEQITNFFVQLRDGIKDTWDAIKGVYAIGRAFVVSVYEWSKALFSVVQSSRDVVRAILSIGAAYLLVTGAIYLASVATAAWAAIQATLIAIGALASPIGLTVAAVALLVAELAKFGLFDNMFKTALAGFEQMANTLKESWGGIINAVRSNDFALAMQIVFKTVELIWRQTVGTMKGVWIEFQFGVMEWMAENATIFGDKDKILRGLRQLREERKEDLLNTPAIQQNKAELKALIGAAAIGAAGPSIFGTGMGKMMGIEGDYARLMAESADDSKVYQRALHKLLFETPGVSVKEAYSRAGKLGLWRGMGTPEAFKEWMDEGRANRIRSEVAPVFVQGILGMMFGAGTPGTGGTGFGHPALGVGPSSLATHLAKDVSDQFLKTGGLGGYDLLTRNVSLLEEAYLGQPGSRAKALGGAIGGLGLGGLGQPEGLLSKAGFEYGIYQQYEQARKGLGQPPGPPPLAYRGTVESQDIINKAQQQVISIQEQVRNNLEAIKEAQLQEKEYMRQVVEELKKWNEENYVWPGAFGGGGDFGP